MRIILLLGISFFFFTPTFGQVVFQSLTTLPLYPEAGKELSFTYNPKGIGLENVPKIDCIVYFKDDKEIRAEDITLQKEQAVYKGKITIPRDVKAVLLSFQDSYTGKHDEMERESFPIKIYDKKRQIPEEGYAGLAELYSEWTRMNGKNRDNELVVSWFEEEFEKYSKSKRKYIDAYLGALKSIGIEKSKILIIKELAEFERLENLQENELILLHSWYEVLNAGQKKTQYANLLYAQYPKGKFAMNERYFRFIQEPDNQRKIRLYEDFKKDFPQSENLKSMQLNLAYSAAKDGNWEEFESMTHQMKLKDKASLYNSIALECAETETYLDKARELARQIIEYSKNLMLQPTEKKPSYLSDNQWKKQNNYLYATYADTYGQVLSKMGNNEVALSYLKEASEIFVDDAEVNEHYANVLVKSNTTVANQKAVLEKLVREGRASGKVKEILMAVYEKGSNRDLPFDAYLTQLEQPLREKMKEKLGKKLVTEPLPTLDWVDLEGKKINLTDFKGKIVVINFWATWCESCIATFPALQKIIAQYSKEEVVFLFVNTWESAENKQKAVIEFLKENKYPFQVLIDKNDSVIDDFKVNNIFSKIVIDKSGMVRLKNTNLSSDSEAIANELHLMIDVIRKGK